MNSYIVSVQGKGDYTSIEEAIQNATPGMQIRVQPGVYGESIAIDKPLEIVGDGLLADIVIESLDLPCIRMQTDEAVVRNLSIRKRGVAQGSFSISIAGFDLYQNADPIDRDQTGVYIPQGYLTLENCHITSDLGQCVLIEGPEANPIIKHCQIHKGYNSGITFRYNARGTVENCEIFETTYGVGFWILSGGNPVIRQCKIHAHTNGIIFNHQGKGTVESCEIFNNSVAQVAILNGSNPLLQHCEIYNGGMSGLVSDMDGKGMAIDCKIFSNAGEGVKITRAGNPIIRRCQIYDCDENGIFGAVDSLGSIEECSIFENAKSGVMITEGGNPTIQRCKINKNGYEAVWVINGGAGSVEDCDLTGNTRGTWDIEPGCNVHRSNNKEDELL
ncbi:MAG: right-handed parallel beta-helix repeat-containing protein [Trichodesmium sp. MAG_R04]|nr:right-handed parallel beta-helix repeat-containing protein [Trichodesmium sp. MAG_R04]